MEVKDNIDGWIGDRVKISADSGSLLR